MKSENKKIKYSKNDRLNESFLDPKNQRHKITMWIDGDLLEELKKRAEDVGAGYQTFIHKILKESTQKENLEQRISKLEQEFFKTKSS